MKQEFGFMSRGSTYENATLYVYCDACGSFNVKSYLAARKWALIAAACGCIPVLALAVLLAGNWRYGLFLYVLPCLLAFVFFWGDADYCCRKCGKKTSARYNTRDLPSDPGIVDVPESLVSKLELGYWSDLLDIRKWIELPHPPEPQQPPPEV